MIVSLLGGRAMIKIKMPRDKLAAEVLEAIRQEPGCERTREISISEEVVGEATCWHVSVIDQGASGFEAANHSAKRVEERLNPRYELTG
jgi:hypothetical protein